MINTEKVKLMTRMAIYERTKKITANQSRCFEKKHRRRIILRSIPTGVAIGVILFLMAAVAVYGTVPELQDALAGRTVIFIGAAFILIMAAEYVFISVFVLERKYENLRAGYNKYRIYRKRILDTEEEQTPG